MTRTQWAECPVCDATCFAVFADLSDTGDEAADLPPTVVTCSTCGHVFEVEWEGWQSHEDAG